MNSPKDSSPGPDGFNIGLYQVFPSVFSKILELVYIYQLRQQKLTPSMQRSILMLLYKKGDRTLTSNYRPINLMNCDTKILSKIIAYRTKNILKYIINEDQCGFIPHRSIRSNLLRFHDIQTLTNHYKYKESNAVLLDFEKAFDSVNWNIRNEILKYYNFPDKYIEIIDTLYYNSTIQININGQLSNSFQPQAGVKQGDPLSPYLFALYIEPMAEKLRQAGKGLGIRFPNEQNEEIVSLFADDTLLYSKNVQNSLKLLEIVKKYCYITGMKLNIKKCIMVPLYKNSTIYHTNYNLPLKILKYDDSTKYLGIPIGPNVSEIQYYSTILKKIHNRLNIWYKKGKTLQGRKIILNTIIKSTIWHTITCTIMPNHIINPLEKLFKNFIKGKLINTYNKHILEKKVSTTNLPIKWFTIPEEQGGLGYTTIQTQIRVSRLSILIKLIKDIQVTKHIPKWANPFIHQLTIANHPFTKYLDILYVKQNKQYGGIHKKSWKNIISSYWIESLKEWNNLDIQINYSKLSIQEINYIYNHQPIWNNKYLLTPANRILDQCTNTERAQQLYSKLHHHIYSFSDIQYSNNQFISLQEFKERYKDGESNLSISALYNTIQQLYRRNYPTTITSTSNVSTGNTNNLHDYQFKTSLITPWSIQCGDQLISIHKIKNNHIKHLITQEKEIKLELKHHINSKDIDKMETLFNWNEELKKKKILLANIYDLNYRIIHNSLPVGYKFKWTKEHKVINCKFNSSSTSSCVKEETIKHIFWECHFTQIIYKEFLIPWKGIFQNEIQWHNILLLSFFPEIKKHNHFHLTILKDVFSIITSNIIYHLWIFRNKCTFEEEQVFSKEPLSIQLQILIFIKLNLDHYEKNLNPKWKTEYNKIKEYLKYFQLYKRIL